MQVAFCLLFFSSVINQIHFYCNRQNGAWMQMLIPAFGDMSISNQ
jgi:hypothetical protein